MTNEFKKPLGKDGPIGTAIGFGEAFIEFGIDSKVSNDLVTAADRAIGESIASQLPGRQDGGVADAYRHVLLSAELVRDYGVWPAYHILEKHEFESSGGADNGLDMWNNSVGMKIGQYVRQNGGDWDDVVRLARMAVLGSFTVGDYSQVRNWKKRSADDGIRIGYEQHLAIHNPPRSGKLSFVDFANQFNRKYAFRVREGEIVLEGGKLKIPPIAVTSPQHWKKNPKVQVKGKDVELSVQQSQFPTPAWFEGKGFNYETGNAAPKLTFSLTQLDFKLQPEDFAILSAERALEGAKDVPLSNWPAITGSAPALPPTFTLADERPSAAASVIPVPAPKPDDGAAGRHGGMQFPIPPARRPRSIRWAQAER
ncbi:hypothetical protein [Roseibium salinum]|uniref:Uncharacterized protein n=1 Tax=Roseibium salinum TaxID=1604349 RepID=A0ABT3QY16_9HYPH|nr:hypothetical protein [Roseibium sp. DSM 29163]MCX2721814.1 hypothetical protein [Roseibium sp. DSM 29163]